MNLNDIPNIMYIIAKATISGQEVQIGDITITPRKMWTSVDGKLKDPEL